MTERERSIFYHGMLYALSDPGRKAPVPPSCPEWAVDFGLRYLDQSKFCETKDAIQDEFLADLRDKGIIA